MPISGTNIKKVRALVAEFDISHFKRKATNRKYQMVTKTCPVCETLFETLNGGNEERMTCRHACANTLFRSGKNHPNWKDPSERAGTRGYSSICFKQWGKKCWCCDETRIVSVHHLDENHTNNAPMNLIPLCPTHHAYWHSPYRYLVEPMIRERLQQELDVVA
jgi:hypothetical protein